MSIEAIYKPNIHTQNITLSSEDIQSALIIETNLSYDVSNVLRDHQSRLIQVPTWEEYCNLYRHYNGSPVGKEYHSFSLLGHVLPKQAEILELSIDDFHLICKLKLRNGRVQRRLAYIFRADSTTKKVGK